MNLLLVTPYSAADWHRMEGLFDWHRKLHRQIPTGHVLLVATANAHEELRTKLRIAAELAFESIRELQLPACPQDRHPRDHVLLETMTYIGRATRWPWLWLPSNAVPLREGWIQSLEEAYENQPCRYFGPHLKSGETLKFSEVSIYPASAVNDLTAKRDLVPLSSKCRLIQSGRFEAGQALSTVRSDAVLFHACDNDSLINALAETMPDTGTNLIGSDEDFKQVRQRGKPFSKKTKV